MPSLSLAVYLLNIQRRLDKFFHTFSCKTKRLVKLVKSFPRFIEMIPCCDNKAISCIVYNVQNSSENELHSPFLPFYICRQPILST